MVTRDRDARDLHFMERALLVAERGRGRTSPNPMVGAVVVSDADVVLGQGAHLRAGGPHAEVVALEAAGGAARGATLYCTLEPCCHVGRTGPCTERIIASGIRRVVAAMRDPNPRVAGGGFARLRAARVEVTEGVEARAARRMNAPFLTWIADARPLVIAKSVISSDGYVGPGDRPVRLSGAAADRFFHRQRAEVDAIAVGAGTVLIDDPLLTPRGAYRYRPLTRVIFDWRLRVPDRARVFSTLPSGPVIMIVGDEAARRDPGRLAALEGRGLGVEVVASYDVRGALGRLAAREVVSLLVEGGPRLQTAFVEADVVDRIQCLVTPSSLGTGTPWWGAARHDLWPRTGVRERMLGRDRLMEADVHRID